MVEVNMFPTGVMGSLSHAKGDSQKETEQKHPLQLSCYNQNKPKWTGVIFQSPALTVYRDNISTLVLVDHLL